MINSDADFLGKSLVMDILEESSAGVHTLSINTPRGTVNHSFSKLADGKVLKLLIQSGEEFTALLAEEIASMRKVLLSIGSPMQGYIYTRGYIIEDMKIRGIPGSTLEACLAKTFDDKYDHRVIYCDPF